MIFLIFITSTLLELYVLISVGEVIGAFPTISLVILTALIGSILLKHQGLHTLTNVQESIKNNEIPAFYLLEGLIILVSGILLLTPGFITDAVGLLGLIPLSRRFFIKTILEKYIKNNITYQSNRSQTRIYTKDKTTNTFEGDFWEDK